MAGNVIESFLVGLGFQIDTAKLDEFNQRTDALRASALQLGTIFTAAAAGIGLFVQKTAESMGDIADFAELNEISARSVDALGKVAKENDSSMEALKSSLQNVNRVIGEAALGIGRGAMTFKKLGLSARDANGEIKKSDAFLFEIAKKMEGLSRQEQLALASKLGIDESMVKLLSEGADNLERMKAEAESGLPFDESDYQLADETSKAFEKAGAMVGVFSRMLAVKLMPVVNEGLQTLIKWFKELRRESGGLLAGAFGVLATAVARAWEYSKGFAGTVIDLIRRLMEFKVVAIAAGVALAAFASVKTFGLIVAIAKQIETLAWKFAALNASALLIPAVIGAIILAIGLLIDDFIVFREGGDSLIGDLVKKFPQLLPVIDKVSAAFTAVGDYLGKLWDKVRGPITELGNALLHVFNALWPVARFVLEAIGFLFMLLAPIVLNVVAWIIELFADLFLFIVDGLGLVVNGIAFLINGITTMFEELGASIMRGWQNTVDFILSGVDKIKAGIASVGEFFGMDGTADFSMDASGAPVPGAIGSPGGVLGSAGSTTNSTAMTNNQTNVSVGGITIQTADPAKAGEAVRRELDRMNKQSTRNGESAVAL